MRIKKQSLYVIHNLYLVVFKKRTLGSKTLIEFTDPVGITRYANSSSKLRLARDSDIKNYLSRLVLKELQGMAYIKYQNSIRDL